LEVLEFSWSFDRVADIYDRTRGLPSEAMEKLIKTMSAELKDCKRILDVGVGTGRFAEPLQKAGFDIVGIDISKKMMIKAKGKGVQNLLLADATSIPFMDKVFDAAISVHVLHLISKWKKTLKEVCRVTRHAMLSLDYAREDPVHKAYYSLLKWHGHERHHPGKSEQELKDLINPTRTQFATSYDVSADDCLANLKQRTCSRQWEVPEHVNLKIMKRLKPQFAGKIFRQEIYLQTWKIDSLEAFT
jgi:ubiquinone/menaquinone biosynthesis C-methylase UbiE